MVRIHARQLVLNQALAAFAENVLISILAIFQNPRTEFPVPAEAVYDFGS
jgi:hypothetical protein